jgi:non-canonical poly(A) RNA polymerase PAPD5/7
MDSLPAMRPLVMVIKVLLQQRDLNEVRRAPPSLPLPARLPARPPARPPLPQSCPPTPRPAPRGPQVYSGGLGSYALLVLVAGFLQLHPSRRPQAQQARQQAGQRGDRRRGTPTGAVASPLEGNLGVLLLDFLRLFGRSLNTQQARAAGFSSGQQARL